MVTMVIKGTVLIPVSVKLPPFFSAVGDFCKQLESAGGDGRVLFHRETLLGDIPYGGGLRAGDGATLPSLHPSASRRRRR